MADYLGARGCSEMMLDLEASAQVQYTIQAIKASAHHKYNTSDTGKNTSAIQTTAYRNTGMSTRAR